MKQTILLYLTKAEPFVCFDPIKKEYVLKKKAEPGDRPLNGTVCGMCEAYGVERMLKNSCPDFPYGTCTECQSYVLMRSRLLFSEIAKYDPKFAIYLNHREPIEPMAIKCLAKKAYSFDTTFYDRLMKAPQNMCNANWFHDGEWERVIVLSIRARFFCDIMNGRKDIEVRRSVLKELKEMAE